jgi:hypothetical protein
MLQITDDQRTLHRPCLAGRPRPLHRLEKLSRIGWVLLSAVAVTACGEPVQSPDPNDASPAVVAMTAFVPTSDPNHNEEIGFKADCCDATRQVPRGRTIDFLASAADMESGVKTVAIRGEVEWVCRSDDVGQKKTATILAQNPKPPTTINPPLDRLVAQFSIVYDDYSKCMSGFSLVSVGGRIWATGLNTRGQGQTTKALTFEYT